MGWNLFQREQGRIGTSRWSKPAPPQQGGSSGRSLLLLHHQSMPTARGIRQPDPGSPFWCKPTCTSKCLWPSVRHRQRFPIALISLTLIYFKILHRRKKETTPTHHQLFCRASCEAHQGEERLVLTPPGSSSAATRSQFIHQETARLPTQGNPTGHTSRSPCTSQPLPGSVGALAGRGRAQSWQSTATLPPCQWGQCNTPPTKASLLFPLLSLQVSIEARSGELPGEIGKMQ